MGNCDKLGAPSSKLLIFFQVLTSISKKNPIVLYVRDVENLLFKSQRMYNLFKAMLQKLTGPVLVLGSRILEPDADLTEPPEELSILFPYNIEIKPPESGSHLVSWKSKLEEDMKTIQYQDNRNHIIEVLSSNDLDCNDLGTICLADTMVLGKYIDEIVISAVSYHLMNNKNPEYRNGKLVISSKRSVNRAYPFIMPFDVTIEFSYRNPLKEINTTVSREQHKTMKIVCNVLSLTLT